MQKKLNNLVEVKAIERGKNVVIMNLDEVDTEPKIREAIANKLLTTTRSAIKVAKSTMEEKRNLTNHYR